MLALLQGCKHYVALTQAAQRFQIFGGTRPITGPACQRAICRRNLEHATVEFCSGVPGNHGQNVFVIEEWKSLE